MSARTCPNCGLPNAPNAPGCARCGAPLGAWGPSAPPPSFAPPPPPKPGGRSTAATVGIVIGVVLGLGVLVVGVVAAVAIPSLLKARAAANESSAVGTLRQIATAEATYEADHAAYAALRDLVREGLVDPSLTDGATRNGYRFHEVRVTKTTFEFSAEPEGTAGGSRSFNLSEDYVVRSAEGATAPRGTSGKPFGE
jgi:type II secretory pathway pseudopilin PulG